MKSAKGVTPCGLCMRPTIAAESTRYTRAWSGTLRQTVQPRTAFLSVHVKHRQGISSQIDSRRAFITFASLDWHACIDHMA
jgi:hypothetical protein